MAAAMVSSAERAVLVSAGGGSEPPWWPNAPAAGRHCGWSRGASSLPVLPRRRPLRSALTGPSCPWAGAVQSRVRAAAVRVSELPGWLLGVPALEDPEDRGRCRGGGARSDGTESWVRCAPVLSLHSLIKSPSQFSFRPPLGTGKLHGAFSRLDGPKSLSLPVSCNGRRMRGSGHGLHQGEFRLENRQSFSEGVLRHCDGLHGELGVTAVTVHGGVEELRMWQWLTRCAVLVDGGTGWAWRSFLTLILWFLVVWLLVQWFVQILFY